MMRNLLSYKIRFSDKLFAFAILLMLSSFGQVFGQSTGDYRSNATANWNTLSTWQRYNGTSWQTPTAGQGYPGQNVSPTLITIRDNHIITLNVSPANSIGSINIPSGSNDSWITFTGSNSLVVSGAITLNSNSNNDYKAILVNAGSLTASSISMTSGNSDNRDAYIEISTGSVTVSGSITMSNTSLRNYILFSGAGTLNIGGTITGGGITSTSGGGNNPPTSGTVNYNNSGDQTVGNYTYYNLTLSGSGLKTLPSGLTVSHNFTLEGSATASPSNAFAVTGTTTLSGTSVLTLGAADILSATPVILNGGTFSTGESTGFGDTVGTLDLEGNSTIDLGTGAHSLVFSASNGISWNSANTLIVIGWSGNWDGTTGTEGKIYFGNSDSGITSTQLSQIQFFDGSENVEAVILSTGEIVPKRKTITTGSVSTSPFCVSSPTSASGTVAYTSTGVFSGATFTARLSNGSGSFASPVNIGTATVTGTNPSGSITITIPVGTASGTGYKIRIDCTSPAITGTESSAITIVNGVSNVTSFSASDDDASSSLSWTNPTDCYDEVLIVAKASSSVSGTPTGDGSVYSANLNFGSGTSFGGGYVIYKGTSSPQTISGLTNGTTYFLKAFTRNGTDWSSGVEITANPSSSSLATDYFRSKTSGDWASASTWESSHDGVAWFNASLTPTSSANTVNLQLKVNW